MPDLRVPNDVQQFLARYVNSIAELELLLQLSASPGRWWSVSELYKIVLTNEEGVARTLENFIKLGLARKSETGTFQFSPASDQMKAVVKKLADLYRERPVRVVEAIYQATVSEIEEFAKAFKIRKDT